jgi:protein gp37
LQQCCSNGWTRKARPKADNTKIEWTDATWNPITGCSVVSPGCTNCYAMKLAGTRLKNHPTRAGLTIDSKAGPVWNGQVRFNENMLLDPLRWKRPRMIFVCAHGDLFAENVPDEWINQVFAVMALAPQHAFQVLTKRPERMRSYLVDAALPERLQTAAFNIDPENGATWCADIQVAGDRCLPLPNVWLGISVEDQKRADERIPILLETPAAVRWISAEPLLGMLDIRRHIEIGHLDSELGLSNPGIDWVVVGGESGRGSRPMHPDWARSLRDQCAAADVAFLFKQWGEYLPAIDRERDDPDWRRDYSGTYADNHPEMAWLNIDGGSGFHGARFHVMQRVGKRVAGRLLDGIEHNGFPEVRA